jgi:shikimate kinase
LDEIVDLLRLREPIYQQSADLRIDTEGKTPDQAAAEILARLSLAPDVGTPA